ncbi:MAG: heparan-alpha-glucosaminide N-acetyltransferase domain-containing protein [Promethearchaeota archaeon]
MFLAGTSIILFETKRLDTGFSHEDVTKHLVIRGLCLLLIEWTLIAWLFHAAPFYFGVLAAIGVGFIVFAFIRKLDTKIILGLSLFLMLSPIFGEFLWNQLFEEPGQHPVEFAVLYPGFIIEPLFSSFPDLITWLQVALKWPQWPYGLYPLEPWLGVMGLGVVFGRWLVQIQKKQLPDSNKYIAKRLLQIGLLSISGFFILRFVQGKPTSYFPIWLRDGVLIKNAFSIQNFFFMSKYPPDTVFLLWTLGGMCLALALAFYYQDRQDFQKLVNPIIVFGTAALFFYCAHLIVYGIVPFTLGFEKSFSLQITILVWILGLLILYPVCIEFRNLKKRYPDSFLRYI